MVEACFEHVLMCLGFDSLGAADQAAIAWPHGGYPGDIMCEVCDKVSERMGRCPPSRCILWKLEQSERQCQRSSCLSCTLSSDKSSVSLQEVAFFSVKFESLASLAETGYESGHIPTFCVRVLNAYAISLLKLLRNLLTRWILAPGEKLRGSIRGSDFLSSVMVWIVSHGARNLLINLPRHFDMEMWFKNGFAIPNLSAKHELIGARFVLLVCVPPGCQGCRELCWHCFEQLVFCGLHGCFGVTIWPWIVWWRCLVNNS